MAAPVPLDASAHASLLRHRDGAAAVTLVRSRTISPWACDFGGYAEPDLPALYLPRLRTLGECFLRRYSPAVLIVAAVNAVGREQLKAIVFASAARSVCHDALDSLARVWLYDDPIARQRSAKVTVGDQSGSDALDRRWSYAGMGGARKMISENLAGQSTLITAFS